MVFERPEAPAFETVILKPSYSLALGVALLALLVTWLNPWFGLGVGLFALFLAIQATLLRIHFTATALDLYRGKTRLRSFPYADWTHWEIFWPPLPILFYFNEVNNIHFVPMLFDPQQLADCATARCPRLPSDRATKQPPSTLNGSTNSPTEVEVTAPAKSSTTD